MDKTEIDKRVSDLARKERIITSELLSLIHQYDERELYMPEYTSAYDWLVHRHKFSEGSANRRLAAAKLLESVPTITSKLIEGDLNLTNLARVQSAIRAQEQATGELLSKDEKAHVLHAVENQTTAEAMHTLIRLLPDSGADLPFESRRLLSPDLTRVSANFRNETLALLERVHEVLSHLYPKWDMDKLIHHLGEYFLKRNDPLRKPAPREPRGGGGANVPPCAEPVATAATPAKRCVKTQSVPRPLRRLMIRKANGGCEWVDPKTGKICGSKHQLQVDHIVPRALGGTNSPDNLRCLCRKHNLWMAEQLLGWAWSNRDRKLDQSN